jgi:hypothetical protein
LKKIIILFGEEPILFCSYHKKKQLRFYTIAAFKVMGADFIYTKVLINNGSTHGGGILHSSGAFQIFHGRAIRACLLSGLSIHLCRSGGHGLSIPSCPGHGPCHPCRRLLQKKY